jgi:hypothetical protein
MVSTWRAALGLPIDHSWTPRSYDTDALSRGHLKGFVPDTSSPEAFLTYQVKCQNHIEKGLKTRLGAMCDVFGIEYDPLQAHGAEYDIGRNWLLFKSLVWAAEI